MPLVKPPPFQARAAEAYDPRWNSVCSHWSRCCRPAGRAAASTCPTTIAGRWPWPRFCSAAVRRWGSPGAPFIEPGRGGVSVESFDPQTCLEAVARCRQFDRGAVSAWAAGQFDARRIAGVIVAR